MVDISGLDIGAIVAGIAGLLKAMQSDSRARDIESDRKATKENLDVWKREVEMKLEAHTKSLDDGNARFDKTEAKMDQINNKLDETSSKIDKLIGFVSAAIGQKELMQ